jgi:hypothetical protein
MKKVRNGLINNLRYFCLLAAITLGLVTIVGTGGGGSNPQIDPLEAELVEAAFRIFEEYYIYPGAVREPYLGETLEEYVNSYLSTNDIYTKYYDESEMLNISEILETDEILIIRTYSQSILYIAFEKFVKDTAYRVIDTINSYISQSYDKLILDLRVNSGGSPDEAIYLLEYFTTSRPVNTFLCGYYGPGIYTEYYLRDSADLYSNENTFDSSNMYILTSAFTASAAEILVAGLLDFNEATQIGSTTFGKNRVITIYTVIIRGDGFTITNGIVYHSDKIDREGIGIIPEDSNLTTDPFVVAMKRLNVDASDQLQDDWQIPDIVFSNLYSQSYWREKTYFASLFRSLRMLQSPNESDEKNTSILKDKIDLPSVHR